MPTLPEPLPAQAAAHAPTAPGLSHADEPGQTIASDTAQRAAANAVSQNEETSTPPQDRRHNIADVPAPWGVAPQQGALRGVITCHDTDGRCSYEAPHKCHSTHSHWSRCIVVDYPDVAVQWEDTTEQYTSTRERKSLVGLIRCERCAVGIHPACAVDYSEWTGKAGEPGGAV